MFNVSLPLLRSGSEIFSDISLNSASSCGAVQSATLIDVWVSFGDPIYKLLYTYINQFGGARSVMVIVVGNGHGYTSSNPGPG